jgi:SAM-dependent methyltransferase
MAIGAHHGPLDEQVREGWVEALEQNAAFERPWVDEAAAWLLAGPVAATPLPGPAVDVGAGAGGAAIAFAHRLASPDSGGATDGEVTHGGASSGRPLDAAGGPGGDGGAGGNDPADGGDPAVAPVVAVDRDPRLLALARRFAEAEGVAERIRFEEGAIGDLPVEPESAGLVWASGVVHHIADQQAAIDELAGLLAPGGTLAIGEGGLPLRCLPFEIGVGRPGLESRLDDARSRWFTDLRAELHGPPLPYGWPAALARAGLADVRSRSFLVEATPPLDETGRRVALLHLTSARQELAGYLADDDRETVERLLDESGPYWVGARDDLVVTAVRTINAATRP